jgi:hypothetical protein
LYELQEFSRFPYEYYIYAQLQSDISQLGRNEKEDLSQFSEQTQQDEIKFGKVLRESIKVRLADRVKDMQIHDLQAIPCETHPNAPNSSAGHPLECQQ